MKTIIKNKFGSEIEAVIFDFGGVVMDIDITKSVDAFRQLNIQHIKYEDIIAEDKLFFRELELGLISPSTFIKKLYEEYAIDERIREADLWKAWSALLQPYDAERIERIRSLKKHVKTYLLSNTNLPHRETFRRMFNEQFADDLEHLFDRCFYSDELHLRKPDPEIYQVVTQEIGLHPNQILFIDDNEKNIRQASAIGWKTHLITNGESIKDVFTDR